jgi:hypothetical protein
MMATLSCMRLAAMAAVLVFGDWSAEMPPDDQDDPLGALGCVDGFEELIPIFPVKNAAPIQVVENSV